MMPNVIAIVDDAKIRGQLNSFFKEMDEEGIRLRSFTTGFEFEQKYFAAKKAPKAHPLNCLPGFERFTYDQIEAALAIPLTDKPAFVHPLTRLKLNFRTRKVEHVDPVLDANQTLFSRFPEDLLNESDLFGQIIPAEFRDQWQVFLKRIQTGRHHTLLPMKISEKELAWVKIHGQMLSQEGGLFELADETPSLREPIQTELERRRTHKSESEELQLFSEIDLVIFKIDCISGKVPQWIDQTWRRLRDGGYFPKDRSPRLVLLKYEDDGIGKLDVLHPRLDDLIYLPLDRLIFLQKLEIIFALPKKVTPSHLFSQEVNLDIEISKLTKLERISDLGMVIRNPVRLVPGLLAHFFLTLPGDESPIDVWGKVIHSDPHPEREHEFLVTFSFFALRRAEAQAIKRYIAKAGRFQPFLDSDREKFMFNPDDLFLADEDRRLRQVAVLDVDSSVAEHSALGLSRDINHCRFHAESSLAAFGTRYLGTARPQFARPPVAAGEGDLFQPSVILTIHPDSLEMATLLTQPTEEQQYFGQPAAAQLATPTGWSKPLTTVAGNLELLNELVGLAKGGRTVSRAMFAQNQQSEGRILRVTIHPPKSDGTAKVELSLPGPEDLKSLAPTEKLPDLDVLVIDYALIPGGNVTGFLSGFREQLIGVGLARSDRPLRLVVTCDPDRKINPRDFSHPDIYGVVLKPTDPRQLSFLVANALKTPHSIYRLNNQGWANTLLPIHVAKEIHLESLSEFGATIRHSRPIAPGTVLFLRGGIFDNAPNRCLAARFYHCEDHPKEKGQYQCALIYFGINDGFMKYARRWFRETYAQSKQTEGG